MALTAQYLKPTIPTSPFFSKTPFSLKTHTNTNTNTLFFLSSRAHSIQYPPPVLSRRLFLPSVSSIWDALTGGSNNNNAREAVIATRNGMSLFRQGDVLGSLAEFDKAIELDPRQKAYLWQRGLSLYYLDRFEDGAEQFRIDVSQNPNDTEESLWCFLCEAQLYGVDGARARFLEANHLKMKAGNANHHLTIFNLQKKAEGAKLHILAACQSPYGQRSDDYMASLAKVHCLCRGWNSS
ncbi:hypothetical protein JRO89_XSUnG0112300 [Xanthoceras sorbifolium]|uniref:Uncharacterized protein n=1 Tax=Xanthoceras sorbifolium TaxID=99658 RepID=A0ABQ8GYG6_9ROSI|nr:hypothetical protein JRO89_XSUnG0112300 [Xanthoceras sorbifolium]